MIEINELTESDNGCKVIYTSPYGETEVGVITSWNSGYVFVRYGTQPWSKATIPSMLEFESRKGKP